MIKHQMVMINAAIYELKKAQSVSIILLQKNSAVQNKPLFINNKQTPEFQENIASFSSVQCSSWPFNSQFGCFLVVAMLVWTHSTMHYRKAMTKLNENNVTYVIQTMTSMNYFDSSRKNLTYILNGSR
jgi:hypothetical protein